MFICASPLGEAQLNRMLDRCRPLGPASPTGRVNTWPSSTLTPASTADLRPRPTCSATSASVLLRFIRWCSRLSVKVGYERSPASPAASRCSSIPNACLSYANLNPSNPLGRGTRSPGARGSTDDDHSRRFPSGSRVMSDGLIHKASDLIGDRYRIKRYVGAGGMQEVYKARDELLARD